MLKLPVSIWIVVLLLGLSGCATATPAAPQSPATQEPVAESVVPARFTPLNRARILRLDSYHADYLWSQSINQGAERGLAEYGYDATNTQIAYFYMDTKRNTATDYLTVVAQQAETLIRQTRPDVVIASDNNAIRLVLPPLADAGIPIVFAGLNDDPETYLGEPPYASITGILERAHVLETFRWIDHVFGETRITAIFDDSITSATYLPVVNAAIQEMGWQDRASIHHTNDFEEWQQVVTAAVETSDILVIGTYHTLRDSANRPIHEDAVMAWMVEHSTLPIVPFWEFSIQQGALGGSVISGESQGYEAGRMAAQILNGAQPADLPIITPTRGKLIVNSEAIEHWDVSIPLNLLEISAIYTPDHETN